MQEILFKSAIQVVKTFKIKEEVEMYLLLRKTASFYHKNTLKCVEKRSYPPA